MDEQNLINMANRIGDFFDSMPRMRRRLLQALDQPDPAGLQMTPIVREAIEKHRAKLTPTETPVV
jgi:formate dehydrogenase subunit delta